MKIFVIGFNKTGTNSITKLLKKLNINTIHLKNGNKSYLDVIDEYDAFTDGSPYEFEKYYEKNPDSLFILNTRPIKKWLISRYKHASNRNFIENWCWPFSFKRTYGWILEREKHFVKVLDFFKDKPEKLLIVNIEKKGFEKVIINFINNKINFEMENNNLTFWCYKTKNQDNQEFIEIIKNIDICLKNLNYTGNEVLTNNKLDINKFQNYL